MSGRSPDDEHDDVTDPGRPRRSGKRSAEWSDSERIDPADPRLADAIRRLQEAQSGAWDEDSLPELKGDKGEPVAQEEITGTLSRYLENALASSLAELEEDPDDEGTDPDPSARAPAVRRPRRPAPEPPEPQLPGRVLAHLPRDAEPQWPPPPTPQSMSDARAEAPTTPDAPPEAVEPSLPIPEASLPELPDELGEVDEPTFPDPAPGARGGWDEEPVLSTSFEDDLGPVDEFTLSIHPELVRQAIADVESSPAAEPTVDDEVARTQRNRRPEDTPTANRVPDRDAASRLRQLLDESGPPADGTVPTVQDRPERTVAIPEDEPELTVTGVEGDTRPDRAEPTRQAPPPESVGERTMDILAAIADMPPDNNETIGGSLERLDELMSIADAPPEVEETIGAALERIDELLSIADSPPQGEETIGASLERLDQVKRKLAKKKAERQQRSQSRSPERKRTPAPSSARSSRPSSAPRPRSSRDRIQRSSPPRPVASPSRRSSTRSGHQPLMDEDSIGGALEPVDEVPDVVMPGEAAAPRPGDRRTPPPAPRRPSRPRAVRPSDELTQALPDKYQPKPPKASEELTQALPDEYQPVGSGSQEKTQALPDAYLPFHDDYGGSSSSRGSSGRPAGAPPPETSSDFMRREHYQPARKSATPPPSRSRGGNPPPSRPRSATPPPAPPKSAPPPEFLEEEDDPYKEPILAWAATLFGFILFGGFAVLFLIAVLMVF